MVAWLRDHSSVYVTTMLLHSSVYVTAQSICLGLMEERVQIFGIHSAMYPRMRQVTYAMMWGTHDTGLKFSLGKVSPL